MAAAVVRFGTASKDEGFAKSVSFNCQMPIALNCEQRNHKPSSRSTVDYSSSLGASGRAW